MIENYLLYLKFISSKLDKFFDNQKDYIKCARGCAKCCKNAQFPYTLIEIKYLMFGFMQLEKELQAKVEENIRTVIQKRLNSQDENFVYDCPFLIDDVCTVYNYRGVICRTFGLMTKSADGHVKIPFCAHQGLNYSDVLDLETEKISSEKVKKLGFAQEPAGFLVSYDYLTDKEFEDAFHVDFGEKKLLIDWFIN